MKDKAPKSAEHVNPNLIPMIDIMFLLLLFFMLGADMGQRDLEDVQLPLAKEAKPEKPQAKDGRITINAHHRTDVTCSEYGHQKVCRNEGHWKLAIHGQDCTDPAVLASILQKEAAALISTNPEGRPISEKRVMIRADGAAPYALAQRAMNTCAKTGIYKVEVGAATPQAQ